MGRSARADLTSHLGARLAIADVDLREIYRCAEEWAGRNVTVRG